VASSPALAAPAPTFEIRPPTVKLRGDDGRALRAVRKELGERAVEALRSALVSDQCYAEPAPGERAEWVAEITVEGERSRRPDRADRFDLLVYASLSPKGAQGSGPPLAEKCEGCAPADLAPTVASVVDRLVPDAQKARRGRLAFASTPAGASVFLDGSDRIAGTTPFERPVCGGDHHAVLEYQRRRHALAVTVEPGRCEEVVADFSQESAGVPFHRPCGSAPAAPVPVVAPVAALHNESGGGRARLYRDLAIAGLSVGGAALVSGAVLIALDGRPTCDPTPPSTECRSLYATLAPGIALTAAGAALAAGGGVLAWLSARASRSAVTLAPVAAPGVVGLTAGGRF